MKCSACSGTGVITETLVYMVPTGKAYEYSGVESHRKVVTRGCLRCGGKRNPSC